MEINGSNVTFESGNSLYAGHGVLGLVAPDKINNYWTVTEGGNSVDQRDLSNNDLVEMAEHMMLLWSAFRDNKMGV